MKRKSGIVTTVRCLRVALALSLLLSPGMVAAQTSDQARIAARDLGYEGLEAYDAGNIEEAVEKLSRAYELLPVPTLALWLGRAHEKQGRLVEASERYLEATRFKLEADSPDAQRAAQTNAAKEREALMPRIPKLVVQVVGAPARDVSVLVGGRPLDNAVIGVPVPFNPGELSVVGQYRGERIRQAVTLREGEQGKAVLRFDASGASGANVALDSGLPQTAPAPAAKPVAAPPTTPGRTNQAAVFPPPEQTQDGAQPGDSTLAYVALGLGGAGLVTGAATGLIALSKRGTLENNCQNGCPPEYHDENNSYDTMRNVSTAGFIVGVVGVGVGLGLLLTDSSEAEVGTVRRLEAWLGLEGVAVRGQF